MRRRSKKIILFAMDVILMLAAVLICRWLYFKSLGWDNMLLCLAVMVFFWVIFRRIFRIDRFIWRFSGEKGFCNIVYTYALTFFATALVKELFSLKFSVLLPLAAAAVSCLLAIYVRAVYKVLFSYNLTRSSEIKNERGRPLAIVGAGAAGTAFAREIRNNVNSEYTVWGFFDDDPEKAGMTIEGKEIKGTIKEIPALLAGTAVKDIVIAMPSIDLETRRKIIDICNTANCRVKIMPEIALAVEEEGKELSRSIRDVQIEDLLGRSSIVLENAELNDYLRGKTVLVTGGGGSIGSELCRQIARTGADTIVIFDIAENGAYLLQN